MLKSGVLIYHRKYMKLPKILAPAGAFDSLQAALDAGADEVYFGIANFNMRATAARNFTFEDLSEIVYRCKEKGVKTCLTLNIVMYNDDLVTMRKVADLAKENGVDALICADMSAILYANSIGMETHISTQVSVSNTESLKFYSQFADRIVLAREVDLPRMKEIAEDIKNQDIRGPKGDLVEIEVFAHGALCVAVSGRCAMSLYCSNTSANKGKCSQVCRRKFKVIEESTGQELKVDNNYVMSSSDLCTIGMLPELIEAGASVLKFEGRGRPPEYVDTVISCYHEALESINNGDYDDEKIISWNKRLGTVFNRGFSKGFYMGRKEDEWAGIHGSRATKEKFLLGQVVRYYPKIKVVEVKVTAKDEINEGEEIIITGDKTGIVKGKVEGMLLDEKPIKVAKQKDVITFKLEDKVREKDKFYVMRKRESLVPRGREKLIKE